MELLIFQDSTSPDYKCQDSHLSCLRSWGWDLRSILEDLAHHIDGDRSGFECLIKKRDVPTKYLSTATGSKD